jgi:hypothetical protein
MKLVETVGWQNIQFKGYKEYFGLVTVVEIANVQMLRVEVPHADGSEGFAEEHTYGAGLLYSMHAMTEEAVREHLRREAPKHLEPCHFRALGFTPVLNEDDCGPSARPSSSNRHRP